MRTVVTACIVLALCTCSTSAVRAQQRPPSDRPSMHVPLREAARQSLRPEVRPRAVFEDTVVAVRTHPVENGRVDVETGAFRARYRIRDRVAAGLTSQRAAIEHLVRSGRMYGITRGEEHLEVESVRGGVHGRHVRLRQTLSGVPVYGRDVTVSLDGRGQPTMVVSGYAAHLEHVDAFDPTPSVSPSQAERIAQSASSRGFETSEPQLVVYPSKPPKLAWQIFASSDVHPVVWDVLVDARTGAIMRMLDVSLHGHPEGGDDTNAAHSAAASRSVAPVGVANGEPPSETAEFVSGGPSTLIDGTGYVFDPDPLTSAGVSYGGEYVDGDDADTPALTAQLFEVTLRDITWRGGLYYLEGPYVRIVGDAAAVPAEESPDGFTYTRSDDRFEAVNAYYHIDKSQRYVQSLGFTESGLFPIKNEPVRVNPQAFSDDDSNYNPGQDLIRFGTGGVDDAEDADVIWHEYAHALLNFTAPGLTGHFEGKALHEGWADYWAASYSRFLSEDDSQIPAHDWRQVYNWDGNNPAQCWFGRRLDHTGHYPDDMSYEAPGCQINLEYYQWGLHWATTLMEIYDQVGRTVIDRLNLASHAYLGSSSGLVDAAEALIQADYDLYDGAHSNALVSVLGEAGYVDASGFGPLLAHEPLKASEQTGGTVSVQVTATSTGSPVDSVSVVFAVDGGPFEQLALDHVSGDLYEGELPLPQQPATVTYYIEAVDAEGRRRRMPATAPSDVFSFDVGPDEVSPVVVHDAPNQASVIAWPIDLFADVDDNLGIDSVWVEYSLSTSGGETYEEGRFGMSPFSSLYAGRFPATSGPVQAGDRADYRIVARDASSGGNLTTLPAQGTFTIEIDESGLLRAFNFEGLNLGLVRTGVWEMGEPSFGLRVARSGSKVWATRLSAAYPDHASVSTLELPPVDLDGLDPAYLVFWHWHDFEHDGLAVPGEFDDRAGLWDGGNVKISVDGGQTWNVAGPRGGYNGRIADGFGNPLGGESGFGGYSYGWRREIIELPAEADVRIRFDAGTDDGNDQESLFFAGWHLDDVTITTELPADSQPPAATGLPPKRTIHVAGREAPPAVAVVVTDDTGVEAVLSEYSLTTDEGTTSGSVRLAMSGTDQRVFEGFVVPSQTFEPGDRIEHTLVVRDFDGNATVYGDPFVIDFRAEENRTALDGAVATGVWQRAGGRWQATRGGSAEGSAPVSSLILEPFTLPSNSEQSDLVLLHAHNFGEALGGNVKVSSDDGSTWHVLEPEGGYPSSFTGAGGHPMEGEPVFTGASDGSVAATFDLAEYAGRTLRIRVDLAHPRDLLASESWIVNTLSIRSLTPDDAFRTERELTLYANFPDPVVERTTISYTVPGDAPIPVRLSVFDLLGRRVAVIRHARHEPGTFTLQYDASDLASGVYILYLETANGTRSERMVVAR